MMVPAQVAEIRSLYASGMSGPKVAAQLGITDDKVYYYAVTMGGAPKRKASPPGPRRDDELDKACEEAACWLGVRTLAVKAAVVWAAWGAVRGG